MILPRRSTLAKVSRTGLILESSNSTVSSGLPGFASASGYDVRCASSAHVICDSLTWFSAGKIRLCRFRCAIRPRASPSCPIWKQPRRPSGPFPAFRSHESSHCRVRCRHEPKPSGRGSPAQGRRLLIIQGQACARYVSRDRCRRRRCEAPSPCFATPGPRTTAMLVAPGLSLIHI